MQQNTVTLIVAIVGIAGTFGSGYFSQRMARHSQREQWLIDQRKEEFRELILALEESMRSEADHSIRTEQYTPDERRQLSRKMSDFYTIVRTRIFTVADVRNIDLDERWSEALGDYRREGDADLFRGKYESLLKALVDAATAPPPNLLL
jgi:hypothetical protein